MYSPSSQNSVQTSIDSPSVSSVFQQPELKTVVGPSDHYGVHHQFMVRANDSSNKISHNQNKYGDEIADMTSAKRYDPSSLNPLGSSQGETKVYVILDSRTPVIFKIPLPSSSITLLDLKTALPAINQPGYKYFFKSNDSEFGIVKEEIQDDYSKLPTYRNRIVAWIVTPGRIGDELASRTRSETNTLEPTYSNATSYDDRSSTLITTDVDSTSYFTETEEDTYSYSNYSESSSSSATQTDETAVRCATIHVVLTDDNELGIRVDPGRIDGLDGYDGGVYVTEVSQKSILAGRVESGDKVIQVNDTTLEELSNGEAIRLLEDAVSRRGALKLVVAKFEDSVRPKDAIHPIDTAAWVAHAQAITMPENQVEHGNSATSSPSFGSNAQDTDCIAPISSTINGFGSGLKLNKDSIGLNEIIQYMKLPRFGLDIRDREWLKIKIPQAFLGSQLVNWLERNVHGFASSRDAKKFAGKLLKEGHIRDPISKKSFSSKSYYTFVL